MPQSQETNSYEQTATQWANTAKDHPVATAAAAAGAAAAVGAGVFLWSKRNTISSQISRLSDQISDWADEMQGKWSQRGDRDLALTGGPNESSAIESSRATRKTGTSNRGRATGAGKNASTSGTRANATTGGRSTGLNETF